MEVRIGVQHAARELVVEVDQDATAVEQLLVAAVESEGLFSLTDTKGRRVLVPAGRVSYVELGGGVAGQVGFRS
ncbi:MAG: DUF3107 domain-containing protein [Nocardioides sp.]